MNRSSALLICSDSPTHRLLTHDMQFLIEAKKRSRRKIINRSTRFANQLLESTRPKVVNAEQWNHAWNVFYFSSILCIIVVYIEVDVSGKLRKLVHWIGGSCAAGRITRRDDELRMNSSRQQHTRTQERKIQKRLVRNVESKLLDGQSLN